MSWLRHGFRVLLLALPPVVGCSKSAPNAAPAPVPVAVTVDVEAAPPAAKSEVPVLTKKLRALSPTGQREAAEALALIVETDPTALPALLDALNDPANRGAGNVLPSEPSSVREAAVVGLLAAGPAAQKAITEKAVPTLIAGLSDKNPAVREHTAYALARLTDSAKSAVPALWKLASDPGPHVRTAVYEALRRIGPPSGNPAATLLLHEDVAIRSDAASALRSVGPFSADAVPDLTKALNDTDPLIRAAVSGALADIGSPAAPAVPKLIELLALTTEQDLAKPDPLELAPLRALSGIGEPAVAALRKSVESMNPIVRLQAVFVLGEIGPPAKAALPDLEKALRDPIGAVALEAARGVARISGDATRAADLMKLALTNEDATVRFAGLRVALRMGSAGRGLTKLVTPLVADPEPDVRRLAIDFAGTLDPESAKTMVPALAKQLASDTEEGVRRRAVEVLAELGPIAAPAAESLGSAASKDDSNQVRTIAVVALSSIGSSGKAGLAGLIALAGNADADAELRGAALVAMARVGSGDTAATDGILRGFNDRGADIRISAARASALLDSPSATVLGKLGTAAKSDASHPAKLAALRALAELGPKAGAVRATVEPLAKSPTPDVALWSKVILARIDGKPADGLTAVRASWSTKSPTERIAAVQALPLLQPSADDVAKLGKLFKDRSATFRRAAVESAGACGKSAEALVPRLVELLRDLDGDVRTSAVVALGQIGDSGRSVREALRESVRTDPLVSRQARQSLRQLGATGE